MAIDEDQEELRQQAESLATTWAVPGHRTGAAGAIYRALAEAFEAGRQDAYDVVPMMVELLKRIFANDSGAPRVMVTDWDEARALLRELGELP